ncbi:transporter [Brevibacillus sp. MS2.2]|uniref:transporter n=1 Tax=Brevibacillus sp. MS2.2 TaxID=2738981 RepID=UPI00156B72D0|nr:transporter [Brevibacillus sp. MS2.2]NRR20659.1 transporter [Brevibacillus sp. MS2.2]
MSYQFPPGGRDGSPDFPGSPGSPGSPGGFPPPPPGPPPSRTPSAPGARGYGGTRRIDAGGFYPCLYRYTYVWLKNGRSFWFYPVYVSRHSVTGYRWTGYRWEYYGTDLNRIAYFTC